LEPDSKTLGVDAGQRLKEDEVPMSAAATAAGYLYASGRLRGRGSREEEATQEPEQRAKPARKALKVAVYEPEAQAPAKPAEARPKAAPKIQYRTRRWKPE
jgi:hypothetical protein